MIAGKVDWSDRKNLAFDTFDLFDRVINLRFRAGLNGEDTYVIRSDYEINSPNYIADIVSGKSTVSSKYKGTFQRCKLKPSIKLMMKQVSNNTAIEIDLYVSNFFMLSKDGKVLMSFNAKTYPLKEVDIQMGYFGQFEAYYGLNDNHLPTKEQYFSLDAPSDVKCISCQIQYVQTDSLPPNYTLHIHGYVGSCYNPPVYKDNEQAFARSLDTIPISFTEVSTSKFKFRNLAHYLFNNVTSRFFRRSDEGMNPSEIATIKQKVGQKDAFVLDEPTAKNYGVRVFLSECLVASDLFYGKYSYKSADGTETAREFFSYGIDGESPMQTLNRFMANTSNSLRVLPLNNGDYAMYLQKEFDSPQDMKARKWYVYNNTAPEQSLKLRDTEGKEKEVKIERLTELKWADIQAYIGKCLSVKGKGIDISDSSTLNKLRKIYSGNIDYSTDVLPCVNNINQDALTTIVCPFFFFLNTFDTLKFNSRYPLGGLVNYYTDGASKDTEFTVLWIDYTFATVEDANECNIVAVGKEG